MAMSGGLLWVAGALLLWHLRGSINFVDRDDGIITLAHAKSLVQSGSISVGAFGDRVAGFSAPLHFMVGVVYFLLGGSSYQLLGRALGFLCLIGIGATTGALVGEELQTERAPIRWAALVAVAGLQLGSWSFFGWQFSGMENPIGALLLIVIMWRWDRVNASLPSAVWLGVMLGLLSIVRLDTITLAAPLTAVIVIESLMRREERSLRHVGALALPACLISLTAVTLWYLYFGSVGSTTIANRSRDAAATLDLLGIAALGVAGWLATLWAVHRMSRQTPGRNRAATGGGVLLAGCAMLIAAAALSVRVGDGRVGGLVMTAMWSVGVIWTAGAVVSGWSLPAARPKRLAAYTTVVVWVPCYALILGPSRIHPARVVSMAVPVLSLATVVVVAKLIGNRLERAGETPRSTAVRVRATLTASGLAVLTLLIVARESSLPADESFSKTFYLGWVIAPRDTILLQTARQTVGQVDQRLIPIVANPDLGRVAFRHEAQVVDLGKIGDPLLLRVLLEPNTKLRAAISKRYFFDIMPPDTWMLTEPWSCTYRSIRRDPRFDATYRRIDTDTTDSPDGDLTQAGTCSDGQTLLDNGVYTLRNPAARADLQLASDLVSERILPDDDFFSACRRNAPVECFTRMRAYRRAFPGAGPADEITDQLAGLGSSPAGRLARALITSPNNPQWADEAFDALVALERSEPG